MASVAILAALVTAVATYSRGDSPTAVGTPEVVCPGGETAVPTRERGGRQPPQAVDDVVNVVGEGSLDLGTLLPETGDLAFLGPAQFAAVELAVHDINAGGGVFGRDVTLSHGDSGGASSDLAEQEAHRLTDAGVDAVIGASSSVVSSRVMPQITGAGVLQFSPANTSPVFTEIDDRGLYFRTAPSDRLQALALSDLVRSDGYARVAVIARDDAYGTYMVEHFARFFTASGGNVVATELYEPPAAAIDAQIDEVVDADPAAVVVIGFRETAAIIVELERAGLGPNDVQVYGTASNMDSSLPGAVADPTVLACMKGTIPLTEVDDDFEERLLEVEPDLVDFSYAAESYDAAVITALAAEVAGADDGPAIAAQVNGVTRGGTKCTSFQECKALVHSGVRDIDYDGVGGPYEFSDAGEPTTAMFAIGQFGAAGRLAIVDYRQARF